MKKKFLWLMTGAVLVLGACTMPQAPTTVAFVPSDTPVPPSATAMAAWTAVPATTAVQPFNAAPSLVPSGMPTQPPGGFPPEITPGAVSGPYAVVLVMPNDVLNVRAAPGTENRLVGTLAYNETGIYRTGASASADDTVWWEVQSQGGVHGWVNAQYLTEYVAASSACDEQTMTLLNNFEHAIVKADGGLLVSLVSPRHGVDVWLYRTGNPVNFDAEHARWVFESTYVHDWGMHPASGLNVQGSFRDALLPNLRDTFAGTFEVHCNESGVPGWNISAWPEQYANIAVYKIYKPGSPGVDLDYRTWLAGIEYVSGRPYLFALIQFFWIP